MPYPLPRIIALCGNPKAGKSEVQKMLHRHYGYEPIDDGHVLREFAVEKLGLSWDDVATQEGKVRETEILGKTWQHRKVLGEFGKVLEGMFGEWIMPFIATRNLDPNKRYSFGGCRKTQGLFYRQMGGLVVEIDNPDAGPSGNDFDLWDKSAVNYVLRNDAPFHKRNGVVGYEAMNTLANLEGKVFKMIEEIRCGGLR